MINQVATAPGDRTVPWIKQCYPEWSVKPLKYMTKINARALREDTDTDFEINYIDISSVDSNGRQNPAETMAFGDAPSRARRVVANGDVIISTVRTYLKAISYIENANDNLICSTGFAVITSSPQVHPKFLFYWVRSEWFINEIVARSVGVSYPAINAIEIGNLPFPAIPVEEQKAIADFLDRETARIDELIAGKQRLIELLQEQRTVLITRAVTKGLNPDVPMKDSGVDWLGQIQAHWEVKPLKRLFKVINGATPRSSEPDYWDGDIPWVTPEDLGELASVEILHTKRLITQEGYNSCGTTLVPTNSLVLSTRAPIGHLALAAVALCTNQGCRSLVPYLKIISRFFYYVVLAARQELVSLGQGSTFMELGKSKLEIVKLPFPLIEEQQSIADFLDHETSGIDSLVDKINQAIEKLQEHRTALITAAVTGKIDVRQHVS